jgi:MFS transporter, ACS family, hexuronate transporter
MRVPYQWVIVGVIWVSHTIYFLNYMTIGTLAPLIKSELGISSARIGLLSGAISIGSMVSQIPVGALSDRFGAKWVMAAGLILIGLSSISVSAVSSYVVIFLLLMCLGAGIGANQTPGSKAIITWFPKKGRATGMGIKQTGINMGGILASFLLPVLALRFDTWRYPCALAGLAAILTALLIFFVYRDPAQGAKVMGQGASGLRAASLLLLKNRDFLLVCGSGIFLMATQFAFATYFILYASSELSFPLHKCGVLLGLAFLSGALGRIGWSMLSDYLFMGKRNSLLVIVGVAGALTCVGLVALKEAGSSFLVYLSAIAFGLTGLGWNALYLTRVGELPGRDLAGIATGMAFVVSNIGAILGPPVFGYLVDVTGSYTVAWLFLGFCMAMVVLLSKLQGEERLTAEESYG